MQQEDYDVKIINVNNSTKGRLTNGAFKVCEDGFGTVSTNMEDVYRDVVSFCQIVISSGYKGLSNQDIEERVKDIYEKAADRKLFLKGL